MYLILFLCPMAILLCLSYLAARTGQMFFIIWGKLLNTIIICCMMSAYF